MKKIALLSWFLLGMTTFSKAQLDGIIVEEYHVSDSTDCVMDARLKPSSITYRVYADLAYDYHLQAVFGIPGHPLKINTSTFFYNHYDLGMKTGDQVGDQFLKMATVALDSWLTTGGASMKDLGITLEEDSSSYLVLNGLKEKDGLVKGEVPKSFVFEMDLSPFAGENNGKFECDNCSLASLAGSKGPTQSNRVLLAQLTTDGELSFELNLQLRNSAGHVVQYVAQNPTGEEIQSDELVYHKSRTKENRKL